MNALRNKTVTELNQTVWTKKELLNVNNVKKDIEKPKAEIVWVSELYLWYHSSFVWLNNILCLTFIAFNNYIHCMAYYHIVLTCTHKNSFL